MVAENRGRCPSWRLDPDAELGELGEKQRTKSRARDQARSA